MDNCDLADMICRFPKTFYQSHHQKVLRKMSNNSTRGKAVHLKITCFKDTTQKIGINSHFSQVSEVTSGGPQGPALEFMLLIILIKYFKN